MGGHVRFVKLVLTSPAKNYAVEFHAGINLIAGPMYTGKSSVLELLDYALGASMPPNYPELTKCSDVLVEMVVNGETLTLRRNLKSTSAKAHLYEAALLQVLTGEATPIEILLRHNQTQPSISLAILERLDLATFKVKTAPTKEDSDTNSFSLRDLLFLIYIDQDRMGSKTSFFEDVPAKAIKWKAAFEIVHELFDASAAALAEALSNALKNEEELKRYLENARRFLDQFRIPGTEDLLKDETRLLEELKVAEETQRDHRKVERTNLGASSLLADRRNRMAEEERTLHAREDELQRSGRQLGRLRVQYQRELSQWEFLRESQTIMGSIPVSLCPACLQNVVTDAPKDSAHCGLCKQELRKQPQDVPVENQIRAVRRRIADLDAYLEDLSTSRSRLEQQRAVLVTAINESDQTLRRVTESTILPATRAILETNELASLLRKQLERVREQLSFRRRARGEGSNLALLQEKIEKLRAEEGQARQNRLSPEEVIKDLTAWYQALLAEVGFPTLHNAYIDQVTYRPFVRGQPYPALSSKGAIALSVTLWHLTLLEFAIKPQSRSRFPRLLMLDSPLNHVGRAADDSEFRDQKLVDAFYAMLRRLHQRSDEFQLIMVDNHPPSSARDLIAVEFTGKVGVGRYGLIDDESPILPPGAAGSIA